MKKTALQLAGIIFLIIDILHLLRLWFAVRVSIGGWDVPPSVSIIGFAVALALSVFIFKSNQ